MKVFSFLSLILNISAFIFLVSVTKKEKKREIIFYTINVEENTENMFYLSNNLN